MYVTASYQDPNAVWPYFSRRFQEEAGSPGRWAEQERLSTLWYVYFTQYPEAEVSGDTAKVRFQVRESRTGGPRLVTGTWVCVDEGGEWKLDRLEDENT
jgi:eukaryotic-like serine/threonine-protein kinase